jgi:uncharacterized membrane protein
MRTGSPRRGLAASGLLLAALFVFSIATLDRLPERIPTHFDLAGRPDGFAAKSLGTWLLLPVIAAGMALFFALIGRLVWALRDRPEVLNVPAKAAFLRLPPEARERVVRYFVGMLHGFAAVVVALFLAIQAGTYLVATGRIARLHPALLALALAAILAYVVAFLLRGRRLIHREASPTTPETELRG